MAQSPARTWREFWNRANRIYVNDRHLAAHCRVVADDILSLRPGRDAAVLDWGCGEALDAGRVAASIGRLYLYDAAPEVRGRLAQRFAAAPGIAVLDDAGLAALPERGLDLIVVNSVLQYVAKPELPGLLAQWRRWLKPGGRLVLADIVPPRDTMAADTLVLLRFARREGFLVAALLGLAATLFSDYRRLRARLGLSRYGEDETLALLKAAGFDAKRRVPNFGINPQRMTFVATPGP
jgi:SAM-dependent methyltransferase